MSMRIKELIALLRQCPDDWDVTLCVPDRDNLIDEYSLMYLQDAGSMVYLPSEESEMLDTLIFDPCQLMKYKGIDLDDWLREKQK